MVAAIHQTKPAALEVNRINVFLEVVQPLRRKARAKRTQKRFQRLMCKQMSIVVASCTERSVAMRTLFFVDLDLLAFVLGELVTAQSTNTRKIFLALIAFVSFLFMNITNVPSQNWLRHKLSLTTRTNKSHLSFAFLSFASKSGYFICFCSYLLLMKINKQNKNQLSNQLSSTFAFGQKQNNFRIRVVLQFNLFFIILLLLLLLAKPIVIQFEAFWRFLLQSIQVNAAATSFSCRNPNHFSWLDIDSSWWWS